MITWIQKYFQSHFRTVFALLLAGTIISFVFTIGAAPGIGSADRGDYKRPFFGRNLASSEDSRIIFGDAELSLLLNAGYSGADSEQLQQYGLQRYAALSLATSLHIPAPNATQVTEHLKTLRAFSGQNGEFDAARYNEFTKGLREKNARWPEAMVSRVLADDYRIQAVQKLLAGPGYTLPADIRTMLARVDTTWTVATGIIELDSYQPSLKPTEEDLTKYFEQNAYRYEIPPQFAGSYISFTSASELPKVTLTEDEIRAYYNANSARFLPPAKDGAQADPAASYPLVRAQVENTLRQERARRLAQKIAADLSVTLYDKKADAASIPAFAKAAGHELLPLTPFSAGTSPKEISAGQELSEEAFKLGPDRLFTDAIPTPDGAVILVWEKTIPARQPSLAEVRTRVLSDYTDSERRKGFVELGRTLKANIENRLKAGESFEAAAKAATTASAVRIELKTYAPFSYRKPSQDSPYQLFSSLERLEKGGLSDFIVSDNKGTFIHALDKKTPEFSESNPFYTEARTQVAAASGNSTAGAQLGELVEVELKKSAPANP